MKCPKCGGTIYADNFCPRCGSLASSQQMNVPGIQNPQAVFAQPVTQVGDSYEEKVKKRKLFRKAYRIPLIAAAFFLIMDLYLGSAAGTGHLVDDPWPFIFEFSRLLGIATFLLTLIMRTKAPMLFFIWAITAAISVRFFAVIYRYGVEGVTLPEWVWGVIGLVVVASFWILKYGVHHRVKNW
jgi:hypothetical protein